MVRGATSVATNASQLYAIYDAADEDEAAARIEAFVPLWLIGVLEAKQITEGPVRKGAEFEYTFQFLGKRFKARFETTEYEVNRRLAFRTISGPIDMETTVTYEPVTGGTRVHQVVEGDPRGFFKVAEPVLVKSVRRQLNGSLENLKDLL